MLLYVLIGIEILLLFFFSRTVSKQISQTLYLLFKNQKIAVYLFAFLYFPGVVIHEIAHYLMAKILFVPTGTVEFVPVLRGTELKLGSVAVAKSDPFRRALIGVAPFLFGVFLIFIFLFSYNQLTVIPQGFRALLVGYSIFEIANTMFSSRKDMEGTIELLLALLILGTILYFAGIRVPLESLSFFQSDVALTFVSQAAVFLAIPLCIDVLLILVLSMLLKVVR